MVAKSTVLFFLFSIIFVLFNQNIIAQIHEDDLRELELFYIANCNNCLLNWSFEGTVNNLEGVKTKNGRVRELILIEKKLSGELYNLNLPYLERLHLANRSLDEDNPWWFTPNPNDNRLTGRIPNFNLPRLKWLNLAENNFSGTVPNFNFANLETLQLHFNSLSGTLPEFNQLNNLKILEINDNQLSGVMPNFKLPRLQRIFMSNNGFVSKVPDFDLPELIELYIGHNNQIGPLPNFSNMPKLQYLDIGGGGLNGEIPDFRFIPQLVYLALGKNEFTGEIPDFNLPNLEGLYLDNNILDGEIPDFSYLGRLKNLNIANNCLEGGIPEFDKLRNIERIKLSYNKLGGCYSTDLIKYCNQPTENMEISQGNEFDADWEDFCNNDKRYGLCFPSQLNCHRDDWLALKAFYDSTDGDNWTFKFGWDQLKSNVPPSDCNLDRMHGVVFNENNRVNLVALDSNNLNGSITKYINKLSQLGYLIINKNTISGEIPTNMYELTNLTHLDLSNNIYLYGNISSDIENLVVLKNLKLHFTGINGTIPNEIGNLSELEILDLGSTLLGGEIPESLSKLVKLRTLILHKCDFISSIPKSFDNLIELTSLDLNGNGLYGNIPTELGALGNLKQLDLSENGLTGIIPKELGNLDNLTELKLNFNRTIRGCYDENLLKLCDRGFTNDDISQQTLLKANWEDFCSDTQSGICERCNEEEWNVLNELYANTSGKQWTYQTGWEQIIDTSEPPENCNLGDLIGVTFDECSRISNLKLNNNELLGNIDVDLSDLNYLQKLDLSNNRITAISNFDQPLSNINDINFSNNQLASIPDLSYLTNLNRLNLENNYIDKISDLINITTLDTLTVQNNKLSFEEVKNLLSVPTISFSPQYHGSPQIKTVAENGTITLSLSEQLPNISKHSDLLTYTWYKEDGTILQSGNDAEYIIENASLDHIGTYSVHITDEDYVEGLVVISMPIELRVEGYDESAQPVVEGQLIYEGEILSGDPLRNYIVDSCGCNRNIYLLEFTSDDKANTILGEIDATTLGKLPKGKANGGRNNIFGQDIFQSEDSFFRYEDQLDKDFIYSKNDPVRIFILDSGLDYAGSWERLEYLMKAAPIDDCYGFKHYGYSYIGNSVSYEFNDYVGHGTFGFRIITNGINEHFKMEVIPIKIFDDMGQATLFDMVCGLYHAIDHSGDIVNISGGINVKNKILDSVMYETNKAGLFVVASAGNDSIDIDTTFNAPASYSSIYDNVISVTSTDSLGLLSNFANWGAKSVTCAVRGENIEGYSNQEACKSASGTSISTFAMTRAIAVEYAKNKHRTYQDIWAAINLTSLTANRNLDGKTSTGKELNLSLKKITKEDACCQSPHVSLEIDTTCHTASFVLREKFYRDYSIEWWETGGVDSSVNDTIVSGGNFMLEKLKEDANYSIKFTTLCNNGKGSQSGPLTFSTKRVQDCDLKGEDVNNFEVLMYPNPALDFLNIHIMNEKEFDSKINIKIVDMLMQEVLNFSDMVTIKGNSYYLPISNIAPGVYFVFFSNGDYKLTKKVTILR